MLLSYPEMWTMGVPEPPGTISGNEQEKEELHKYKILAAVCSDASMNL